MTYEAYCKLRCLISQARYEARRNWLSAWELWPGAKPSMDLATSWAREIEALNDAAIELQAAYEETARVAA